jgi:hypothetical protein
VHVTIENLIFGYLDTYVVDMFVDKKKSGFSKWVRTWTGLKHYGEIGNNKDIWINRK